MNLKQLFADDNAVSPVIGVILMVAITVILAAVIGTFVLGMGENVNQNAQAGVSFTSNSGTVDVQLTSLGNVESANHVTVRAPSGCYVTDSAGDSADTKSFGDVGNVLTVEDDPGATEDCSGTITVVAELDGNTNVIANEDI